MTMLKSVLLAGVLALALPVASVAASRPGLNTTSPVLAPLSVAATLDPGVEARVVPETMVLPEYPPAARQGRIKGLVHLTGVIDEEGRVKDLECMNCKGDQTGFRRAAIAAVGAWNYQPALAPDGTPVSVSILFEVRFVPR